jgi:hypothetical protein
MLTNIVPRCKSSIIESNNHYRLTELGPLKEFTRRTDRRRWASNHPRSEQNLLNFTVVLGRVTVLVGWE